MKRKMNLTPKSMYAFSVLVLLAGAGLIYMTYQGIEEKSAQIRTLQAEVRNPKELETELAGIEETLAKLQSELRHLERGVPANAYIPTMAKELETVGIKEGITVMGVRPQPVVAPTGDKGGSKRPKAYEEHIITVKGRGSFGNVMRFLQAMNRFPKIVAVKMMNLSPKVDPLKPIASPNLDVEIEFKAYAFKEEPPKTALSQEAGDPKTTGETGAGA